MAGRLHCSVRDLSERGHGQERIVCDGVISEVWGSVQRFNRAHLPFGTTEEASRVTGAHPHHPPGNGDQRINQHSQVSSPHDTWLQQGFTMCPACNKHVWWNGNEKPSRLDICCVLLFHLCLIYQMLCLFTLL